MGLMKSENHCFPGLSIPQENVLIKLSVDSSQIVDSRFQEMGVATMSVSVSGQLADTEDPCPWRWNNDDTVITTLSITSLAAI
jgi:hypothetical protein